MLSPAGVHLEVRILAELLDADEDAPEALRLAASAAGFHVRDYRSKPPDPKLTHHP